MPPPLDNYARNQRYVTPGEHSYNTSLPPDEERGFLRWLKKDNVPFDPSAKTSDYDMRGFYDALQRGDERARSAIDSNDGRLHYPDYWKTPYHQTFSNESQWALPTAPHWDDDKLVDSKGAVMFDDRIGRDIGGMLPTQTLSDVNPVMQGALQKYQKMTPEQLQEAALRAGNNPQGDAARKILMQKRMMPSQPSAGMLQPQNPMMAAPGMGDQGQPQLAKGGMMPGRAEGGISPSMEMPIWTRDEARESTGYLHGATPGRADAIKTTAPSGSYVLPADVVSGLGEGNSLAGAKAVQQMLSTGPWGAAMPKITRGSGPPKPPASLKKKAGGGGNEATGEPIPVMLSHGEFVIPTDQVKAIGGGSAKNGFKILDHLVLELRRRHIEKLKKLPPPAK